MSSLSAGEPVRAACADATSQSWVDCVHVSLSQHHECIVRLHALLLRVARHEVFRRATSLGVSGPEIDDVAQQAADDALMAIRGKIIDFRGESRFTTWAYRFVVFEVSTKMGRHFWRNPPAAMSKDTWEQLPDPLCELAETRADNRAALDLVRRAIEEDLSPHQRRVFVAVVLHEVPMDAFAREVGSNRNAIYKVLFDARRRLQASLAAAGYHRPAFATPST